MSRIEREQAQTPNRNKTVIGLSESVNRPWFTGRVVACGTPESIRERQAYIGDGDTRQNERQLLGNRR